MNDEAENVADEEMPFGHAEGEVKGPAVEHWGDDADRPPAEAPTLGAQLVGDVGDDGEAVKGPDPEVWG
jgi:hypothetical protein